MSLLAVMFGDAGAAGEASGDLDATEWTQPALYALQAALVGLWASVGVRPDVVLGHSVGEIAAAHAAGVFDLEAGLRFATRRGALMGALPRTGEAGGGMVAVFASLARVRAALEEANAGVPGVGLSLAADNGAHQVVSGPVGLLSVLEERLSGAGVRTTRLTTSHGFHSGLMDPVLGALEEAAGALGGAAPAGSLVSNVTGRVVGPEEGTGRGLLASSGAVSGGVRQWGGDAGGARGGGVVGVGSARGAGADGGGVLARIGQGGVGPGGALEPWGSREGDSGFVRAVAGAYEAGVAVSFEGLFAGERRRRVTVPTYPFQRARYWVTARRRRRRGVGDPLLGEQRSLATGELVFETELSASSPGWLLDHRVFGRGDCAGRAVRGAGARSACGRRLRARREVRGGGAYRAAAGAGGGRDGRWGE